ncbi:lysophospholipid acyltransferase family protein [Methyloferula stellata]|uniref:lysophospholipid acyltransferase family protein n=1 Tax=Methyloferula stellata TaxID=876270 RepID=UPI000364A3A6|nr:lysophospholipid acyltransferase family protein [Methyloferula stellata]
MIFMRSILFNLLFYVQLIVLLVGGSPCLIFGRHAVQNIARLWARNSIWLLDKICGAKLEFRGVEHLPQGACIIASKHQSFLETFSLTTQAPDFSFVLKRELMVIPFFGWYLKRGGLIGIDRSKRGTALTQLTPQVRALLAQDRQFIIFPEGTRRPVGAPPHYKSGVAHLYLETGAICIPVALNTGLFWPRRSFWRRPGRIVIEFLEPIPPGFDKETFMRLLQTRIETATDRLVAEACLEEPALRAAMPAGQSISPA